MPTFGLNVSGTEGKPKLQISVSDINNIIL